MAQGADVAVRIKWTKEKKYDALIGLAMFACEARPEDYFSHSSLTMAFENAGRWAEAAESWRTSVEKAKAALPADKLSVVLPRLEARREAALKKKRSNGRLER